MNFLQRIWQILGISIAVVGFLFLAVAIISLFDGSLEKEISTLVVLFVLGIFPLAGGVKLYWSSTQKLKQIKSDTIEIQILKVANSEKHKGSVTTADVAVAIGEPIQVVSQELERLHAKGVFDIGLTDRGVMIYRLRDYANSTDKHDAV